MARFQDVGPPSLLHCRGAEERKNRARYLCTTYRVWVLAAACNRTPSSSAGYACCGSENIHLWTFSGFSSSSDSARTLVRSANRSRDKASTSRLSTSLLAAPLRSTANSRPMTPWSLEHLQPNLELEAGLTGCSVLAMQSVFDIVHNKSFPHVVISNLKS